MKDSIDIDLSFAEEDEIRQLGNSYLNSMMDIWHTDSKAYFGHGMRIMVCNRRKHPALSDYKGLHTQITISTIGVKKSSLENCLVVWYDPYEILYAEMLNEMGYGEELVNKLSPMLEANNDLGPDYEPADNLEKLDWDLVLRRIGLWVLRTRGYSKIKDRDARLPELETLINNECRIPPLNALLSEIGYDFKDGLKATVEDTLAGMEAMISEPPKRMDRAVNALRLWNLMEVCSDEDRERIEKVISGSFPRIKSAVSDISEAAKKYDLVNPEGNLQFGWYFIKENRLPGNWEAVDEIKELLKESGKS